MFDLKNKVALVTGGASGIGLCSVKEFLKNDVKGVAIIDVNEVAGSIVAQELKNEFGDKVIFVKVDITAKDQFEEAFKETIKRFGYLDIVINSAGVLDDRRWKLEVDVNLNGTIHGNLLALDYIQRNRQGSEGVIVNIASIAGISVRGFLPIYNATKHAIVGLSRTFGLKAHYERTNIKVICVCPGPTTTTLVNYSVEKLLGQEYMDIKDEVKSELKYQRPESVGEGIIKVISTAETGSVWIIENGEAPYEIEIPFYLNNMFDLEGKVALVTGGASGIGLATVKELLANGLKGITIVDFNDTAGKKVVQEVTEEFGANKAIFVKADIGDITEFRGAFDATIEKFNNLDIVINNAGILDEVEWEKMIKTNINGTIHGILLALEYIQKYRNTVDGVIINVASIAAFNISGYNPIYTSTKHAIGGLSHSFGLNTYYNNTKVKVITICPTATYTPLLMDIEEKLSKSQMEMYESFRQKYIFQTPNHVAKELVLVMKNGTSGSVWIIENCKSRYQIEVPHYSKMRML
ncbi:hypothetical protein RI129_008298 [Pyrocoelia pectoralis]|uniref:Alcohol dehydrogenase n=1 Tax=Pyrocoelia pectoralis TaxID=417401 RepID=A0AAN7VAV2_9COLE